MHQCMHHIYQNDIRDAFQKIIMNQISQKNNKDFFDILTTGAKNDSQQFFFRKGHK